MRKKSGYKDLGPISLNWFEELTSEAPPYDFKRPEDREYKAQCLNQAIVKTPKGKQPTNSPSASTPIIFKEQNKSIPLFASPIQELDQTKTETDETFSEVPRIMIPVDQSNETASPSCLLACSAVLKETSGTIQNNKCVLSGSLLRTPKLFEAQTQKGISESLGAEVDPDMSWSSSLATPPSLSPTVIIDRENDSRVSGTKQHNERLELIMHSLFSKYDRSLKENKMDTQSASRIEDVCSETPSKIHSKVLIPAGTDDSRLTRSGLKTISSLYNLKKRPKRFIYTVNNSPVYQEDKTTEGDGSSHLMPNCADLKYCVSEAIRNEEKTEGFSGANKPSIEQKQHVGSGFLSNTTLMNVFQETPCNEKSSTESGFPYQSSVVLQTDRKRERVMLPSHIAADPVIESSKNKFHKMSQKDTLNRERGRKYNHLTNFSSLQEVVFEESTLAVQPSKLGNSCSVLELATQHCLESNTPMTELGFQTKKILQPTTVESSKLIVPEKNVDRKQFIPIILKGNTNDRKQTCLAHTNHNKTQCFGTFKTASNKQIALSDNNNRKSRLLFKDIEDQFLECFPGEGMNSISNQNVKENVGISSVGRNVLNENSSNFPHVSDSLMNGTQFNDTQNIFPFQSIIKNQQLEGKQNLTASQEAEVIELSNILEETGSQFEFTQFKKHQNVMYNTCEMSGSFSKDDLNSEVWKDIDFEETFENKVLNGNDLSSDKHMGTTEECKIQAESSKEIVSTHLSSRERNINFPTISVPLQHDKGDCNSAGGKEMSISDEIINRDTKFVSDLYVADEMLMPRKPNVQRDCSNSCKSNWNDSNSTKARCEWHQIAKTVDAGYMMKNNTINFVKENIKDLSKVAKYNGSNVIQITSTTEVNLKIVKKYSVQMTANELSSTENNHNFLVSHHYANCGEAAFNYNLSETLSDLTCLAEVAKTEEKITFNDADENPDQKKENVNNPESNYLLQNYHTVVDGNIFAGKNKIHHSLGGSCIETSSSNGNIFVRNEKEDIISMTKHIDLNQNGHFFDTNHQKTPEVKKKQASAFHTASGKQIMLTDESLAKAKHLFSEVTDFPDKVDDVTPSIHTSIKQKVNEEITTVRKELGEAAQKHGEVLNPEDNFEHSLDLFSSTVRNTESFGTVKALSLEVNATESKKTQTYTTSKKGISKTVCFDSDGDQHLYIEESGTCSKQNLKHLSSRDTCNVLITKNNKKLASLDLTCNATSKTSYSDLEGGNSVLHHSRDAYSERNSIPEDFTCIFEGEASTKGFNVENNVSIFKEMLKNESCMSYIHHSNLLDTLDDNNLQKYSISEAAASASKPWKARPVAFNTASGKTVEISQEALKRGRQLLHEDCCESMQQNITSYSKANNSNTSESCHDNLGSRECVTTPGCLSVKTIPMGSSSALHFSRVKESCEDDQALKCTGSMSLNTVPESNCQMNNKAERQTSDMLNCIKSDFATGNCGLFCTASGKPVQLSEESLKKARLLFSEIENELPGHQSHVSDCAVSSVKNKATPVENKPVLSQEKRFLKNEVNSNIPYGFSTASGKQVHISQKALQSVTGLLKEFDVNSDGFSVDQPGQGHSSPIKAPATEATVTADTTSDFKPPAKCHVLYLNTKNPNEKKASKNSLNVNIPTHVPHTEKYKQLVELEKNYATNFNTVTKGNLDSHCSVYTQIPEKYLEIEASESAKAFMKDNDLTNSEVQKDKKESLLSSERSCDFLSCARTGKRCIEGKNVFGEPPIKRKLLYEFNQSERSNSPFLNASRSTPDGTVNDRKKFTYNISLNPLICSPFSKTSADGTKKMENSHRAKQAVKVFVPPFRTKSSASENEIGNSKESVDNRMEELNAEKVHEITSEPVMDTSTQITAVGSECEDTYSDLRKMVENLRYSRNLQEMRIMKKQKQRIRPQPGSLYLVKKSASSCRIPLKVAVKEKLPHAYFSEQLYAFGVSRQCIKINSRNAEDYQFVMQEFFNKEYFLERHGLQLADGGYLIPNDEGRAGKEEFYRALCDTPGVDPKLISKAWVYNHYKWIIWKLAATEVAFPQEFANRCLTPESVLLQLKYRYDVEIDKSHRSAIKRIMERDDIAAKTIILCISKIISLSSNMSEISGNKSTAEESKKEFAVVEVTDGWYGIRAIFDPPLQLLLYRQRLTVGQKIIVHGAELVGSENATTPLEAPESLMLKISANSTRRARWYAKLGYYHDPRAFSLPLSSLFSDGGTVGCTDVIVQRIYPTQWMEKTSTGSYIFRNDRAEEREAAKHAESRQKALEALLAKIQAEFEKNEDEGKRVLRSHVLTRQQIHSLQDGAELYEAILNSADPAYMESYFSKEQLKALNDHRQMVNDKKQAQVEAEFRKAVESAEQEEHSSCRRDVSSVIKLRIVDYRKEEKVKEVILNIWRPSSDVSNILKEGSRYKIFHLGASQSKSKSESTNIQLTATKKTQYLQMPVSQEILSQVYQPRECLKFSKMLGPPFQPAGSEVDLVGYIISLRKGAGFCTMVYLSDKNHSLIAVQICTDLKQLAVEDIIIPSALISATNLQWRSEFRSVIPTLFAGDLSSFSSHPKENHLQGVFNELKNTIENDSSFRKDAQCKLMKLLHTDCPQMFNLQECGLDPFSSPWKTNQGNTQSIKTSRSEWRHQSPLKLGTPNSNPAVFMSSELEETPRDYKKRKTMDLLSQVPYPPPVKPIYTFISPALKKAFQPPRSSCTQHERLLKRAECKVKKPFLKILNETDFSLRNNFVADEELAMINTQTLLNNFPEEVDSTDETVYAVTTDSPNHLSPRNNSFQSARKKNVSQDHAKEVDTSTKELNDSLA
ncbi:breast cancer type 2 susceptibility protein isoform X2 [Varanus komodoensis]|uniref:breast cancer type 2 susceptibility protein isoform X2 n=1 Tax=Varanus komodoensis TaxID=61221 RepID=UPI001CF7B719|nr:breast cancer type 2 susceptibility protein isoform X2 [Varanus komodoensis]